MALKSTVFKAHINIADMDRAHYADHALTLARHPSETDERLMLRLLAFALYADETLQFSKGLSTDDEPDLWQKSLSDEIELWIELGLPEESRIRKACGRSEKVVILAYGGRAVPIWWDKLHGKVSRFDNLVILQIDAEDSQALAALAERSMHFQCTIQDGQASFGDGEQIVTIDPVRLYPEA
ncbi:YaeQ family protein [Marinobacter halodurans]|uniref:YaeQ family protein n=1 Tax=Marinobacter halodurans TaxID=2528979 RepID=A0ABY1ZF18_9GAMM|nr:YaeQ family protein [Marinobacter halodurans]TBW49222.1 YaeQ family protein [Marinobacter halodurans]